ncbi:MAG: hypothetical protein ABSG54_00575 [Terriglobia bacterium]|jgi:hypothetical protein
MEFDFLETLQEDWQPLSKVTRAAWVGFYILFLGYAALTHSESLFIDPVFVPIHEGGHLLFGWFGVWPGVLGGTALQLGVPLALAVFFIFQRQLPGTAICIFFCFENFLGIATYMADSLAQQGNYVTVGAGGDTIHDWFFIFSNLGLLDHFLLIARLTRILGWLGMIATVAWLAYRGRRRLTS